MPALRAVQTIATPTDNTEEVKVDSKGVVYERVDQSIRCLVEALLPKGEIYLSRLMKNAVIQPYTHPHPLQEQSGDAAVISVTKGYVELSQMLDLAYNTTHRYTLVCRAMGLLNIETRDKQMVIIIPLGGYQPPDELSEILRELKLRYNDRHRKVRCLINTITEKIESIIPIVQEASEQSYQDELLKRVQRVISAQGVADPDGHIAMSIVAEILPLTATPAETTTSQGRQRIAEYLPKLYRGSNRSTKSPHQQESPQLGNQNQEIAAIRNPPGGSSSIEKAKRTAARATTASKTTIVTTEQRRFDPKNLPCRKQVGGEAREIVAAFGRFGSKNLPANQQTEATLQNTQTSIDTNLPLEADSEQTLNTNGIGNGNNSTRKFKNNNNIPDPDPEVEKYAPYVSPPIAHPTIRRHALMLAKLIEESEENVGAYVQLLKKYDLRAIKAGVIATLLRKYNPCGRKALSAPGGYFTRQVQQFHATIPEQIADLLEIYAQSSYEEIEAALEKQAQEQAVHQQSGLFGPPRCRAISHTRQGQPMDEGMARMLASRIEAEDPHVLVKGIRKMQDGTYAVTVYIDPVEHNYCTIKEWDTYHAQMLAIEQEALR